METIEKKLENPSILKKVKKEFEDFWGKNIHFQYIDDEGIFEMDVTDKNESEIIYMIKDNLFDIFNEAHDMGPCEKCDEIINADYLHPHEGPYLNHCLSCIKEEKHEKELKDYFSSLKEKGLLIKYGSWIVKLYPQFKEYLD